METRNLELEKDIELLDKLIYSAKAARRIALIIISMEQFEYDKNDSIPRYCDEDYILRTTLQPQIGFILKFILHKDEYEDIIEENFERLNIEVFEVIEHSGFMRLTIDEDHFPEMKYDVLTSMAKLCTTFHYYHIDRVKLLDDNLDSIKIIEIENYINIFITHFTGVDEKIFYKPKVRSSTVLKVARIIEKSGLLDVDFNKSISTE